MKKTTLSAEYNNYSSEHITNLLVSTKDRQLIIFTNSDVSFCHQTKVDAYSTKDGLHQLLPFLLLDKINYNAWISFHMFVSECCVNDKISQLLPFLLLQRLDQLTTLLGEPKVLGMILTNQMVTWDKYIRNTYVDQSNQYNYKLTTFMDNVTIPTQPTQFLRPKLNKTHHCKQYQLQKSPTFYGKYFAIYDTCFMLLQTLAYV